MLADISSYNTMINPARPCSSLRNVWFVYIFPPQKLFQKAMCTISSLAEGNYRHETQLRTRRETGHARRGRQAGADDICTRNHLRLSRDQQQAKPAIWKTVGMETPSPKQPYCCKGCDVIHWIWKWSRNLDLGTNILAVVCRGRINHGDGLVLKFTVFIFINSTYCFPSAPKDIHIQIRTQIKHQRHFSLKLFKILKSQGHWEPFLRMVCPQTGRKKSSIPIWDELFTGFVGDE